MNRETFAAAVRRLEQRAERAPRWFAVCTGLLAVLGYGYLLLILLVMTAVTLLLVLLVFLKPNFATFKILLVVGAVSGGLSWAIFRSLWVRLPAPEGLRLTRSMVPELFALIDELRGRLRAPKPHAVLLDEAFNASVSQVPRLGIFGWQKNYLCLGLPLMQGLSREELTAVLAHEFGHLSGNHSRFGGWIYRVHRTWVRALEDMANRQQRGTFMIRWFLDWYWPRFNAHAFVLSRANEYEADACSVGATSRDAAASALLRICVLSRLTEEEFWPEVYRSANHQPEPPEGIFAELGRRLGQGPAPEAASSLLRAAYQVATGTEDTHPSLTDRLRAIHGSASPQGDPPAAESLPSRDGPSAAAALLGSAEESLAGQLSEVWRRNLAGEWGERHGRVQASREELCKAQAEAGPTPTVDGLWRQASLLLQIDGDAAALPVVNRILGLDAHHAPANFVRGRQALADNDEAGVAFVEAAMRQDLDSVPPGFRLLHDFYRRTGQVEQLRDIEARWDSHQAMMAEAERERADATVSDQFVPHELSASYLEHLRRVFATERDIGSVHVVRKVLRHLPERPFYVLAVKVRVGWWRIRSSSAGQKLIERLVGRVELPGHCLAFTIEGNLKALGKKIGKVPDSLVYTRSKRSPRPPPLPVGSGSPCAKVPDSPP